MATTTPSRIAKVNDATAVISAAPMSFRLRKGALHDPRYGAETRNNNARGIPESTPRLSNLRLKYLVENPLGRIPLLVSQELIRETLIIRGISLFDCIDMG